jgi:hypothetical protein
LPPVAKRLDEGAGAGSGSKEIGRWSGSPSRNPAAISRRIGTDSCLASGVVDQMTLGAAAYRVASHFAHARALSNGMLFLQDWWKTVIRMTRLLSRAALTTASTFLKYW